MDDPNVCREDGDAGHMRECGSMPPTHPPPYQNDYP